MNKRIHIAIWTTWWLGGAAYVANIAGAWASDRTAIIAYGLWSFLWLSIYFAAHMPEKIRYEQQRTIKQKQEMLEMWRSKLLDLSVRYLQRKDEQQELARLWQERGPHRELMHWVLRLRMQSIEDALQCRQMENITKQILPNTPEHLLKLSEILQEGYEMMSLWAPGDFELAELLPDMVQLAPLTAQLEKTDI